MIFKDQIVDFLKILVSEDSPYICNKLPIARSDPGKSEYCQTDLKTENGMSQHSIINVSF